MLKAKKKNTKALKSKKTSVLESAIKNVQGKQAVKPGKEAKLLSSKSWVCSFGGVLVIFVGLFALAIILMFYFQNDKLWDGCAQIDGKRGAVTKQAAPVGLSNPASEFCLEKGGIWKTWNNSVGEKGICYFSEVRQCEEWAMFRGECPIGGADLSAHLNNKANQYCLMVGGHIVGSEDCSLPNGTICNILELYRGICKP